MAINENTWQNTVPAILLWPRALFTPEAYQGNLPRFKGAFLFRNNHPDLPVLKAKLKAMCEKEFPRVPMDTLKLPLKLGSSVGDQEFLKDGWVLNAHSNERDKAGALRNPPVLTVIENVRGKEGYVEYKGEHRKLAEKFFFGGCEVEAIVTFAKFDGGITCYLNDVLSYNKPGELGLIAGGASAEQKFGSVDSRAEYIGHVSTEAPSAGMDSPANW